SDRRASATAGSWGRGCPGVCEPGECHGGDSGNDPRPGDNHRFLLYGSVAMEAVCAARPDKAKTPGRGPGSSRQVFRTALPALADLPDVPVEVLAHDAAVTTIGITIVVSVAAIAGTVVTAVIVAAPARANADADANRARAYPNALRVRRHR